MSCFVVADSTLSFGPSGVPLLIPGVGVHVKRGRTFRADSWSDPVAGRRWGHVVLVCGGNDTKKGGRVRGWMYEGDLASLKREVRSVQEVAEKASFVLAGDWDIWGPGFSPSPTAASDFCRCWSEVEGAVRQILRPGDALVKWTAPDLQHLKRCDHWHFDTCAVPGVVSMLRAVLCGGDMVPPAVGVPSAKGEEGRWSGGRCEADALSVETRFECQRRKLEGLLSDPSSLRLLATRGPLPASQADLCAEQRGTLFDEVLAAPRSKSSQSANRAST